MSDTPEKKVVVLSPAGSKVSPSDITRQTPAVQEGISDPMKRDTETGSFKKLDPSDQPQSGNRIIKLKPLQPKTPSSEHAETPISPESLDNPPPHAGAPATPSQEEDATIKIEKVKKYTPTTEPASSLIPNAKQTIKLRPSSGSESLPAAEAPKPTSASTLKLKPVSPSPAPSVPPQFQQPGEPVGPSEEQTISMQKKTIRLTPTSKTPSISAQAPSAPTMKMPEEQPVAATVQPPKPSAPTIKLIPEPAAPSAPTAATPPSPSIAPAQEAHQEAAAAPKRTLKLKPATHAAPAQSQALNKTDASEQVPGEGTETGQQKATTIPEDISEIKKGKEKTADEPGIIFTIAAGLAFLALAYFAWMNIGQFGEQYLGWESGKVPGLSGQIK